MSVLLEGIVEEEHIRSDYSRKNAEGWSIVPGQKLLAFGFARASEVGMRGLICARQLRVVAHF
jgi:hypothetical protein